jgi:hypothetical protein
MLRFRIEDTEGLLFLLPTIVLDLNAAEYMYKEVAIVWFYRQLSWKW